MKSIPFTALLSDIRRYKVLILVFTLLCMGAAGAYGYMTANSASVGITEEEQAAIDSYQMKIEEYDRSLDDIRKSIEAQTVTIDNLQSYIDNSIYMKMDPDAVQYVTTQYAITYAEGVNAGNVNQAILAFIKDGDLKENLHEITGLEVKYWNEVITYGISGNVLNITLMHYDAEKARDVMSQIKQQVTENVAGITAAEGAFTLEEMDTSAFERSEVAIVNQQNTNHNNLRSYLNTRADLETKLVNTTNAKDKFITDNKPEISEGQAVNPKKKAVKFAVLGVFFSVAVLIVLEIIGYLFSSRVRDAADVEECGANVLGIYTGNKYYPEPERAFMDAALIMEAKGYQSVQIIMPNNSEVVSAVAEEYRKAAVEENISVNESYGFLEKAADLKSAAQNGCCILIVERRSVNRNDIRKIVEVCRKFHIDILGAVLCG